jgi:L-fuculose-phosphate aldolase
MDKDTLKKELVHYFRKQYELGMLNTFEGNLSARCGDIILITASQQDKAVFNEEMILELDHEGKAIHDSQYRPSSEMKMHLAAYKLRPDINCVLHNHSVYASAFAQNGEAISTEMAENYMFFGGDIPVCSYGMPGSAAVYADFRKYLVDEGKDAVLLANHGVVTLGKDIRDAFSKAEAVEKLARMSILSRIVGSDPIPDDEKQILIDYYKSHRKR